MSEEAEMPTMAYWPGDPNTPPDAEYLRQAFSGITLVRDHLCVYMPATPLTDAQQAQFDSVEALLRQAHDQLRHLTRELLGLEGS